MMLSTMPQYELALVVVPDFPVNDTKKVSELIGKLLADTAPKVDDVTILGKRALAYPIKKRREASCLVATIEATSLRVSDIEKKARREDEVLRFLLMVREKEGGNSKHQITSAK